MQVDQPVDSAWAAAMRRGDLQRAWQICDAHLRRRLMATMGWCPSGRLFEAAACGGCVVSDSWDGLEQFFRPDAEILVAREPRDIVSALELSDAEIARIGTAARERAVAEHTSEHRAQELLASFELPTDRCAERQPEPIEA